MKTNEIKKLTPYPDVNDVLCLLLDGLNELLGDQLAGLYLTGSLTYGDFDRGSSDIDFLAVLARPLSINQREKVEVMHVRIGQAFPFWAKRIEGSYITKAMLASTERREETRPYVNGGKVADYRYGNEWTLNLYVLHECGVALVGPAPKELFPAVDTETVREASRKDLHDDWEPKLHDPKAFESKDYDSSHMQAYCILTMCRILHRAKNESVASKRVASAWTKQTYGHPWSNLIEKAENWQHGQTMNAEQETLDFIKFTLKEVG